MTPLHFAVDASLADAGKIFLADNGLKFVSITDVQDNNNNNVTRQSKINAICWILQF